MTTTTTMTQKKATRFERKYDATLDDLWALWTTKDGFASWWGPEGFRVDVHELDAREGGSLRYDMVAVGPGAVAAMRAQGAPLSHPTHGLFVEVKPHKRLTIRHVIDFIPGQAPYQNHITVELSHDGQLAHMVVEVEAHATDFWTEQAGKGMESQLTKVPGVLALRARG